MRRAPIWLKSHYDILSIWLRTHWKLTMATVALVASLLGAVEPNIGFAIAVLAGAMALVLWVSDVREHRKRTSDLQIRECGLDMTGVATSASYSGAKIEQLGDGHLMWDPRVDAALPELATEVLLDEPDHDVPPELTEIRDAAIRHARQHGALVFNDKGVRLETDLGDVVVRTAAGADILTIRLRLAPFFSALATNRLTDKVVESRTLGRGVVLSGRQLLVNRQGIVRDLSQSWLANIIGLSTLAITKDNHLVIVNQTIRNAGSAGLPAPSGSGSADLRDLRGAKTLQEVVIAGMERELREECNIPAAVPIETQITGFGRWMEHGGKPEFFGWSRIGLSADEVERRQISRQERAYVGTVRTISLGDTDPCAALMDPATLALQEGQRSLPLDAAIKCLQRAMASNPDLLDARQLDDASRP